MSSQGADMSVHAMCRLSMIWRHGSCSWRRVSTNRRRPSVIFAGSALSFVEVVLRHTSLLVCLLAALCASVSVSLSTCFHVAGVLSSLWCLRPLLFSVAQDAGTRNTRPGPSNVVVVIQVRFGFWFGLGDLLKSYIGRFRRI